MAFNILDIKRVYEAEKLNFNTDEEHGIIRFTMNTNVSPDIRFNVRTVNPRTALFTTILPMNIPEDMRGAVAMYLTRVNCTLLLGNFQLDMSDGELDYKAVGVYEEETGLTDKVVTRLTYVGFNMFDKYLPGVFAILYGNKSALEAFEEVTAKKEDQG